MFTLLASMLLLMSGEPSVCSRVDAPIFEGKFVQVHPQKAEWGAFQKTAGQGRAIVLVHGLCLHPISAEKPHLAQFHKWQGSQSIVVSTLGEKADLFAFAYSQNVPVENVAQSYELRFGLQTLRALGYSEVILVGHSAGGVVCRILVENYQESPVTKVVQLATPNAGTSLAWMTIAAREPQEVFLRSLSKKHRRQQTCKTIPPHVQFVCIVCNCAWIGDGWVANRNQWPNDLQDQGIPAVIWSASHNGVVKHGQHAAALRDVIDQQAGRWDSEQVAATRGKLWWMGKDSGERKNAKD